MTSTPYVICRRVLLALTVVMLLGLAGCCTTPPSVKTASAQAKKEAEFLGKQQEGVLDAFTQFTTDAEKQIKPIVTSQHSLLQSVGEARLAQLNAMVDAAEKDLKLKFETEVAAKAGKAFAERMEPDFHDKLNPKIKYWDAEAKARQSIAAKNPGDAKAQAESRAALVELEEVQFKGALAELELRKKLEDLIAAARTKSNGEIGTAMNGLRDQLSGRKTDGPLSQSVAKLRTVPALKDFSFSAQRAEISNYKTQIVNLQQLHVATLKATDDYLTRPSAVKLVFDGGFEQAKGDLKKLTPKLGPLAGAADKAIDGAFTKIKDSVSSKIDDLSGRIETAGDSVLNRILSEITTAAAKFEKTPDTAKKS